LIILQRTIIVLLAVVIPQWVMAQYAYYVCLSAGTADGQSYAFISKIVAADSILNSNSKVATQFNAELKLTFTDIYSQNPFRFEAVQVERHAAETSAKIRFTHLSSLLVKRGFKVVQVPFIYYADSVKANNLYVSKSDKERFALLEKKIKEVRIALAKKRAQLEGTKVWQNRLNAAKKGWVEKSFGICQIGGPPPICAENHWYKADLETARESYEKSLHLKMQDIHNELENLEKEYMRLASIQNTFVSKKDTSALNKPFYYFPKAVNSGLRQVITGDLFIALKKSDIDSQKLQEFINSIKEQYPAIYEAGEQSIYDISEGYTTYSLAMINRREYLANWKYIQGYKSLVLSNPKQ